MAKKTISDPKGKSHAAAGFGPGGRKMTSRRTLTIFVCCLGLALILVVWLCTALHPLPPRVIRMATGPDGSSYDMFGKRYKQLLAKDGINVILVPTAGGVQNLVLLSDPKANIQAGFVEGGIADETDSPDLASLGTICYEPLWFFSHRIISDKQLYLFDGKKVSVGPDGSDSRALVDELLKRDDLALGHFQMMALSPENTAAQLLSGQIDAAFFVSSLSSPVVRQLITAPGIHLANFSRADAYVAHFPSLYKLVIPEGAADLEADFPPRDTTLLATKSSLIIRGDLHPAIQYLLLEAASQIHSRAGVTHKAGEFPAPEALEIPLSGDARHYYKSGRPFLQRYLPFWLAALAEQAVILMIPVLGLLYPLSRGLMSLYGWGMQRRIFLIYGELHWLEREIHDLGGRKTTQEIQDRLKRLEDRANRLRVSNNYLPMLYTLKENVAYVRALVAKRK